MQRRHRKAGVRTPNRMTKRSMRTMSISDLVKSVKAAGARINIAKHAISVPADCLGIYRLGCVDTLVAHHGFHTVVHTAEVAYTASISTLRRQTKRKKAPLLRMRA